MIDILKHLHWIIPEAGPAHAIQTGKNHVTVDISQTHCGQWYLSIIFRSVTIFSYERYKMETILRTHSKNGNDTSP